MKTQSIFKRILEEKAKENAKGGDFYARNIERIKDMNRIMEEVNRDFQEKNKKSQEDAKDVILNV